MLLRMHQLKLNSFNLLDSEYAGVEVDGGVEAAVFFEQRPVRTDADTR